MIFSSVYLILRSLLACLMILGQGEVVRAENPVLGSDQQSCASRRPADIAYYPTVADLAWLAASRAQALKG